MILIMLAAAVIAIWQINFYNRQVESLGSIDHRVISALKVYNQVLAFREVMQRAVSDHDQGKVREVLLPFQAKFLLDVRDASAALRKVAASEGGLQRTLNTLLSYQDALPGEIETTLEMAQYGDWQAIELRLDTQLLQTTGALSRIMGEIEMEANAERQGTLRTIAGTRYRVTGVLPICFFLIVLASGSLLGARVTRSISEPLRHLESGAKALGFGDFSHRLAVNGNDELATLALAFNQAAEQIQQLHAGLESQVAERTADLQRANESLRLLSSQDPLTGIANRRTLDGKLEYEFSGNPETPISLLMVDVDHFKGLNDAYGHQRGDECLLQVVRAIQSVPLRGNDLVARYGGEEFAVVLPDTDAPQARMVAERMRLAVERLGILNRGSPLLQRLSISIGIATLRRNSKVLPATLLEKADQALYIAKRDGRNRSCAA